MTEITSFPRHIVYKYQRRIFDRIASVVDFVGMISIIVIIQKLFFPQKCRLRVPIIYTSIPLGHSHIGPHIRIQIFHYDGGKAQLQVLSSQHPHIPVIIATPVLPVGSGTIKMRPTRNRRQKHFLWIALGYSPHFGGIQADSNLRTSESQSDIKGQYEQDANHREDNWTFGNGASKTDLQKINFAQEIKKSNVSSRKLQAMEGDGDETEGKVENVGVEEGEEEGDAEEEVEDTDVEDTKGGTFDENTQAALEQRYRVPLEERDVLGDSILLPLPSDNIFEQEPGQENSTTTVLFEYEKMVRDHECCCFGQLHSHL